MINSKFISYYEGEPNVATFTPRRCLLMLSIVRFNKKLR